MTKLHMISSAIVFPSAFDPGKTGWKVDKDGKLELKDGNPIFINAEGQELTVDGGTITRLNGEARDNRLRAERAETALAPFKDIDAAKAKDALAVVAKLDTKKLIDAGEVDKVRQEIGTQYQGQIDELKKANDELTNTNNGMRRSHAFATSKFIQERVAVPAEMFEATFGKNFKVEDGKLVPYYNDGNKVYSKKRMGEVADVDEALEIIIDSYPHKDTILKAADHSGSGNNGGGGGRNGVRTITRANFDKLTPMERANTAQQVAKGEVNLVD